MLPAGPQQFGAGRIAFGEEAQALEHRAVAELKGVADKKVVVAVVRVEIDGKAIRHVLDSAAELRIGDEFSLHLVKVGVWPAIHGPLFWRSHRFIAQPLLHRQRCPGSA